MPRSLSHHHHHPQRFHYHLVSSFSLPFPCQFAMSRATDDNGVVPAAHGGPRAPPADMSHHRLGRVVSDLSHSNSRGATGQPQPGPHHRQSTTSSSNDGGGSVGKAKQKLALLFSGVAAWTRSESSGGETSSREKNRKHPTTTTKGGSGSGAGGARRRGLDIILAVRKYVAMVEQLFASYSGGGGGVRDGDGRDGRRRRPNTFTYARGGGGGGSSGTASKRHKGRLSSAPASLRGSPANSGHLSVGESVAKPTSTPSEVSTMEELHSAIQAAIAHCKGSAADVAATTQGGGGDKQPQQRKC